MGDLKPKNFDVRIDMLACLSTIQENLRQRSIDGERENDFHSVEIPSFEVHHFSHRTPSPINNSDRVFKRIKYSTENCSFDKENYVTLSTFNALPQTRKSYYGTPLETIYEDEYLITPARSVKYKNHANFMDRLTTSRLNKINEIYPSFSENSSRKVYILKGNEKHAILKSK